MSRDQSTAPRDFPRLTIISLQHSNKAFTYLYIDIHNRNVTSQEVLISFDTPFQMVFMYSAECYKISKRTDIANI